MVTPTLLATSSKQPNMAPTESDNSVAAVSLKLPTFWTQQPSIWFAQTEAQFAIRKIVTEETKYYHVVAALDQETATRVSDLLQAIPTSEPYTTLKNRLVNTFDLSDYERASALLHLTPLGDQKPSQLMDKMLSLLGSKDPKIIFRQIFLEHLPDQIRSVLVHSKVEDYKELAKAADSLYESQQQTPLTVNKMHFKKPTANRTTTNSDDNKQSSRICFYHKKFGTRAHRCVTPCAWEAGNEKAGPQ